MFYHFALTIPKNTAKSSPVEQEVKLTSGIIKRVEIGFPPGCAGLVHIKVYHHERQIYPTNPEDDFYWDSYNIAFSDEFKLTEVPYDLTLVGWNLDDTFSHTIAFRFAVQEAARPSPVVELTRVFFPEVEEWSE